VAHRRAVGARPHDDRGAVAYGAAVLIDEIEKDRSWPNGDQRRAFAQGTAVISCAPGQGPVCDYQVHAGELQNEAAGTLDWSAKGHILRHDRRSSIWSLVAKVPAWAAAEAENQ
jgi:hypothetical protein